MQARRVALVLLASLLSLGAVAVSSAFTPNEAAAFENLRRIKGSNPDGSYSCGNGCQCASELCCGGCQYE